MAAKPFICVHSPGRATADGAPSHNLGDVVIERATTRELQAALPEGVDIRWSSLHQSTDRHIRQAMQASLLNLLGGSNAIGWPWLRKRSSWRVWPIDLRSHLAITLLGVGWSAYETRLNAKTRLYIRKLLDRSALHSTRDRHTAGVLRGLGFKQVCYTGCPTMWRLDPDHLAAIPHRQADVVVTMITDYRKDPRRDRMLLETLENLYSHVIAYPQGTGDAVYLRDIGFQGRILGHDLDFIDRLRKEYGTFDYVGTRLHGGIFCLQHHIRSIVISVDNRAREIARDTGLCCIEADAQLIRDTVRAPLNQHLRLPLQAIADWRRWLTETIGQRLDQQT